MRRVWVNTLTHTLTHTPLQTLVHSLTHTHTHTHTHTYTHTHTHTYTHTHTHTHTLRASGHAERFSDLMVKDMSTGECFRADHLLEEHLEKLLADPKCPTDKTKEYKDVMAQVNKRCVCVCRTAGEYSFL